MIRWNFPPNNYGQKDGLNDSGIETFKGTPYDSLAREVIQNSLDASNPKSGAPVQVHFELIRMPTKVFLGREDFIFALEACKREKPDHEATQRFFKVALEEMGNEELSVLKISDYNTTGLLGSRDDGGNNDWENLIKSSGSSDKGMGKIGSFGIGKNAPFACSRLRTVFYATKDIEGNTAFQGVAKMMTHKDRNGNETRGTGFYGTINRNGPIYNFANLDPFYIRDEVGTDILIAGFTETKDWENEIIKSVIENYFVAIHENKLIVKVGNTIIRASRLPELIDKHLSKDPECLSPMFYRALVSPDKIIYPEDDLLRMGKVELYVLQDKGFPKRVAMVRGTGMKIFNKDRFHTPIQFAGVFIARGEGINDFMKRLEPPSHNAWEPQRHDDPDFAKQTIKDIYSWINANIRSLANIDEREELDVEGISQYLPDDEDEFESEHTGQQEGVEPITPKEVEVKSVQPKTPSHEDDKGEPTSNDGSGDDDTVNGGGAYTGSRGTEPVRPGPGGGNGGGGGDGPSDEGGSSAPKRSHPIRLKRIRVFCTDPDEGVYKIIFEPDQDCKGYLKLNAIGDDGIREAVSVRSAKDSDTGETLIINGTGLIGPITFSKSRPGKLEVALQDGLRCAMEVTANAD